MDERWAWVALALVREVGEHARRYHDLLTLGTPAVAFQSPRRAIAAVAGPAVAAGVVAFDADRACADQRDAAERSGARLVVLGDPEYPAGLAAIPLPPPFLLLRGGLLRDDGLAISMVGSRRATPYGLRTAEGLARDLGARGVTVVSGLARGIDTAAHHGALGAGGRTVAVLGSGVDVVYPPENRALARDVAGAGAVISQFPMGTPPLPHHFPLRNRVIAALSLGTVVVEAAERSGALITARCAGELGREVYAVPGNVGSPVSRGTHLLIQDGAKLVAGWEDVVAEWPEAVRRALRPVRAASEAEATRVPEPTDRTILALISDDPVEMDTVVAGTGLPPGQVAAGLMTLELRGLVRQLGGQRYVRA